MTKLRAVRNLKLCTKDCLCLYVCPTHSTDTETGQIEAESCIGCGVCAASCPSHAISMVPYDYPPQAEKDATVVNRLNAVIVNKTKQASIASGIAATADAAEKTLMNAIAKSAEIIAEDCSREAGFMLSQSDNAKAFLKSIVNTADTDFPKEAVEFLLKTL